MDVENTVLAFMICFLFKSSYNVMIMCEWHQLVYLVIIIANKPTAPHDFRCISPFVSATKPKMTIFLAKEQHRKLLLIQIFVQK